MAHWTSLAGGALLMATGLAGSTLAAEHDAMKGDAEAGAGKIATCLACHGQDGNSQSAALGPKIAGQHPQYTARQLALFKSGEREAPVMAPMAMGLSEQDMLDLAAYYASQTVNPGVADDTQVALGAQIYRAGNPVSGVPACQACHGPQGKGNPLSGYPMLSGQHAQYTIDKLNAFRDGAVWGKDNRANAVMAGVSANLTDAEIQAVSSFIEGLH